MSEAAGDAGAGAGAGDGAAVAAAANGAGGAAPGAGGGAAAALAAGAAVAPDYFSGVDADTRGWLQNKGYLGQDLAKADLTKGIPELLRAHRGLESMVGKNRLPVPKDATDKEAYEAIYKAIGRPADAAGYGLTPAEGTDPAFVNTMSQTFYELGLSKTQVDGIVAKYGEQGAALRTEADARFVQTSGADFNAQKAEWGPQADANFAAGQRFVQAFGIDKPMMEKIERAIGTKPMLQLFSKIGTGLSEDRGNGQGNGGGQFAPTAEGAQARLNELNKDKEFIKRYQAGGASEKLEYDKLIGIIAEAAS